MKNWLAKSVLLSMLCFVLSISWADPNPIASNLVGTWTGWAEGATTTGSFSSDMMLEVIDQDGSAFWGEMSFDGTYFFPVSGIVINRALHLTGSISTYHAALKKRNLMVGMGQKLAGETDTEAVTLQFELSKATTD